MRGRALGTPAGNLAGSAEYRRQGLQTVNSDNAICPLFPFPFPPASLSFRLGHALLSGLLQVGYY